jgi:hypothetical protein
VTVDFQNLEKYMYGADIDIIRRLRQVSEHYISTFNQFRTTEGHALCAKPVQTRGSTDRLISISLCGNQMLAEASILRGRPVSYQHGDGVWLSHESALVPIKRPARLTKEELRRGGREKESEWKVKAGPGLGEGAKRADTLTG